MTGILALQATVQGPHGDARVLTAGAAPGDAALAVVLCHGRGGRAEDMLSLAEHLRVPRGVFVAPQAADLTWYPNRFLAPLERNEPHLSSALGLLGAIVEELEGAGTPSRRQVLLGFSQGGCLALEFAGRHARRWGGAVGLSAGLIGPPAHRWDFPGSLDGTPVFLGCSDRDPHVPEERLHESARELERIGGVVDLQIYPGMGHTVNQDELDRVQRLLDGVTREGSG